MCCFSQPVESVNTTRIFARPGKDDRQYLVYSMNIKAREELAMVLPIPTPKGSKEDALKFISLKDYPAFFDHLASAYPPSRGDTLGGDIKKDGAKPKLKVVEVGAYEASFVPHKKDFGRLDERFRLPPAALAALPATYADYGFAVFKLKAGEQKVHPMAFSMPRADKKRLFLPTVHIHDGKVHKTATFDHVLYCQTSGDTMLSWQESEKIASQFMNMKKAGELVDADGHVYRLVLQGRKPNTDTWVGGGGR